MKIKIIKTKQKDLKALFELGKKHWGNKESWLSMDYIKSSFKQDGLSYVAENEGKILGGIIIVREDIARNWIRYLVVDDECQRNGIGSKLLQKIAEHLSNGESIFIDTGVSYKSAIKFYQKNGFKNEGRVDDLYGKKDAYIFKKEINNSKN